MVNNLPPTRRLETFSTYYYIKLIQRYLYRKSYPASVIAPYNATKINLGLVRKALRVGKNIEHFKAAAIAMQSPLTKVSSNTFPR
jgi:Peroxisomal biogenesis factor 11 (PEX11)